MNLLIKLFFPVYAILICTTGAFAWSSADNLQYGFATHQFLNKKAYHAIRNHPAFNSSGFPSLDDIQRHGGVTIIPKIGIIGLGPDKEGNSKFSQHWYNPKNTQGNAPQTIQELYDDLIELTNKPVKKFSQKETMEKKAHTASYLSHFIQDMTCPMHVSGLLGTEAKKDKIGDMKDISPYAVSLYSKETWATMIDRYQEARSADPNTDFFDPLYYDGSWPATTNAGSHVQYEFKVEVKYNAISAETHKTLWAVQEKKGYILKGYNQEKNNAEKNYMASLAKSAASETWNRIGTKNNPGPLWVDLDAIFVSLQIPYEDWWRAVQLTYVTWRSSFCALHVAVDDIKLIKVPNQPGKYKLSVSVDNLEPEAAATGVEVKYKIEGEIRAAGAIKKYDTIPEYELSDFEQADKSFQIDDPKNIPGKITLEITGKYDKSFPDSGLKRVEYDLKDIMVEVIEMPDVLNLKKDSAIENYLGAFNVSVESAGKPENKDMEYRIKSQSPAYGEWVAPEENVFLTVYDKFIPPNDPDEASSGDRNPHTGNPPGIDTPSQETEKICNETKNEVTAVLNKTQALGKEAKSLEDKVNKFSKRSKELEKDGTDIKTGHKEIEKKAVKMTEIAHELEKLSLTICEATQELNDHSITESEHNINFSWIRGNKTELKDRLESSKKLLNEATRLNENSKIKLKAVKKILNTLQSEFRQIEHAFQNLQNQNLNANKRLEALRQKAAGLLASDCFQRIFVALDGAGKQNQHNQEKFELINALYETTKNNFDTQVKTVEKMDQDYQKTAYLIDLSKAYVERAESAAVKGAFCIVLAEGIMERVFIPDVFGIEITTAKQMVARKGLTVKTSEIGPPHLDGEAGRVKEVTPGITKRVIKGTVVTLSYYDELPDKDSLLANANCGDPNSRPVWDDDRNQVMCECLPGTVWNSDKRACIDSKQAALERMNCSNYPGTVPGYGPNREPMCVCPGGLPWIKDLNRCATQQDIAMASVDCSPYPGTVPGWDSQNNIGTCECPYGTVWDSRRGKCMDEQALAIANTDCSHLPGSTPVWSYITNRAECECQSPYSRDPKTGKCVDFMEQLAQNQRDFDKEMENKRKWDQEQQQHFFNNMMNVIGGLTQPNRPGNTNPQNNNSQGYNSTNNTNQQGNHNQGSSSISKPPAYCGIWKVTRTCTNETNLNNKKEWLGKTYARKWRLLPINGGKTIEISEYSDDGYNHVEFNKPGSSGSNFSTTYTNERDGGRLIRKDTITLSVTENSFTGTWTLDFFYKSSGKKRNSRTYSMKGISKIRSYN